MHALLQRLGLMDEDYQMAAVALERLRELDFNVPYNDDKILVLDDLLRGTLRYQTSPTELLFGTDRPYGAAHQFGMPKGYAGTGTYRTRTRKGTFPIPWGDIPARPFLGVSDEDEHTILDIINDHLAGALGRV